MISRLADVSGTSIGHYLRVSLGLDFETWGNPILNLRVPLGTHLQFMLNCLTNRGAAQKDVVDVTTPWS
jgi:hypothetical protein